MTSEPISKAMSKPMPMSISTLSLRSPVPCSQAHAQDTSKVKVTKPQGLKVHFGEQQVLYLSMDYW